MDGDDAVIGVQTPWPASAYIGGAKLGVNGKLAIQNGRYRFKGAMTGRPDYYDFDPKPWGQRTIPAEISTRIVGMFPGTPYQVPLDGLQEVDLSGPLTDLLPPDRGSP